MTYVPSSNLKVKTLQEGDEYANQQCRNDPLEVMNTVKKEWDQLDTWLAKCVQNSEQTSG
jgi:HPt (histidine-containing phosphotransfer) domain-containing protein